MNPATRKEVKLRKRKLEIIEEILNLQDDIGNISKELALKENELKLLIQKGISVDPEFSIENIHNFILNLNDDLSDLEYKLNVKKNERSTINTELKNTLSK